MDINDLFDIIESIKGFPLDEKQKEVVISDSGPLWVIAGPGSGKTEVLVARTLKLIFVDKVNPKSIIITTFTEKAAKNLFDRIWNYSTVILDNFPDLKTDIHSLHIGTLHKLCNDIMLDFRYHEYDNYRLIDEMEQYLFTFEHSDLVRNTTDKYCDLWNQFEYLVDGYDDVTGYRGWNDREKLPNQWRRTNAAMTLFDRIVEERLDLSKLESEGGLWSLLAEAYIDYLDKLKEKRRCDFSHLQKKFLEFLDNEIGIQFRSGTDSEPGISYVMVDEYQDTNPIQEAIYFKLTENTGNLCVVGDDDQALYRFRGGTVDCMVNFDQACSLNFGIDPDKIEKKFLIANYRSHEDIVKYCDDYIKSFDSMNSEGARVDGKLSLDPKRKIKYEYPAVSYIAQNNVQNIANNFAKLIKKLSDDGIIQNYNQCALLLRSVKEGPRNAGHFAQALRAIGIQPYNPRAKNFLEQEEIMGALGAFISIIDPSLNALNSIFPEGIKNLVKKWIEEYQKIAAGSSELNYYVKESVRVINSLPLDTWLVNVNILEILYRILSHEPFTIWKEDPEKSYRLGKLSGLFETYSSIPYSTSHFTRGNLKISSTNEGEISFNWRINFYRSFIGLLTKGLNDPEDEEVISPPDKLPIMTVHQSKGLEFDFVFVYGLHKFPELESAIALEDDLSRFKESHCVSFDRLERAEQDMIRFYFVAYSRAKYALIHLATVSQLRDKYYRDKKRPELAKFKNSNRIGFINKSPSDFKNLIHKLEV